MIPLGLIATRPVSGSRALILPPVHVTRPFLGSSRCSFQSCSLSSSSIVLPSFSDFPRRFAKDKKIYLSRVFACLRVSSRVKAVTLLPQAIHGSAFDDKSLFVALHEG